MKKIALLALIALGTASCKKTYQCECRRIINGETWNPYVTNIAIKDTKKNAETTCKSMTYSWGWQDYQECQLK